MPNLIHQAALYTRSLENAEKLQIWLVSFSKKNLPKLGKSPDLDQILLSSEDGQNTSACWISGNSLYVFSRKRPESSPEWCMDGWTDDWSDTWEMESQTDRQMDGQVDWWTDRCKTRNIMPPVPRGVGIKKLWQTDIFYDDTSVSVTGSS